MINVNVIKTVFIIVLLLIIIILFIELKGALVRKYKITEDDYRMMEVAIIENKPHKAGPQWKFAGAFYFSTVVLAMIGNLNYNVL